MAEFQPRPPKLPKTATERDTQKRIIVVIERACLETAKVVQGAERFTYAPHVL